MKQILAFNEEGFKEAVANHIERKWNILVSRGINGEEYLKIRENLMQKTNHSFPGISHEAYLKKAIR